MNYTRNLFLAAIGGQNDSVKLDQIIKEQQKIMAGISDIQTALNSEHADLANMTTLVTQLLTAFANQTLTPSQAQSLLDTISGDDTTIKSATLAIQDVLNNPASATATATTEPVGGTGSGVIK